MSDLVKRLRAQVPYQGKSNIAFLCHEAADAIAARDAEIADIRAEREALRMEMQAEIARLKALLGEAGKWPTDGYRCRSCDTLFLAENGNECCDRPNWDKLNDEQVADAIKALAKLGGDNG